MLVLLAWLTWAMTAGAQFLFPRNLDLTWWRDDQPGLCIKFASKTVNVALRGQNVSHVLRGRGRFVTLNGTRGAVRSSSLADRMDDEDVRIEVAWSPPGRISVFTAEGHVSWQRPGPLRNPLRAFVFLGPTPVWRVQLCWPPTT